MFWFDKQNEDVLYMDNRQLNDVLCDGRTLNINPDVIADFRDMPFADELWQFDIKQGFEECMRVLKTNGTLIFKWNEDQVPLKEVLQAIDHKPLFGNRRSKTHWLVFMKD